MMRQERLKEDTAVVLDFLPHGYPFDNRPMHKKTAIVQAIGKRSFVLLELVPKRDISLQPQQEVYIGDGRRDKIHHIIGRLSLDKLTSTGKMELNYVIRKLIDQNEARFVDFFNKAMPLTTRMHQLELIPGLGKKHMWEIIEKRDEKPFESLDDLKQRVKLLPDPRKSIERRIFAEIEGKDKYKLFVE